MEATAQVASDLGEVTGNENLSGIADTADKANGLVNAAQNNDLEGFADAASDFEDVDESGIMDSVLNPASQVIGKAKAGDLSGSV